ncbi:MAG: hypothetical protein ACKO9Q_09950, partial [Pirellula sp.]
MLIGKPLKLNWLVLALAISPLSMVFSSEPGDVQVPLWSEGAPGALGTEPKDVPTLTVRKVESNR